VKEKKYKKSEIIDFINDIETLLLFVFFRYILLAMLLPSTSMHSCFCGLSPSSTSP